MDTLYPQTAPKIFGIKTAITFQRSPEAVVFGENCFRLGDKAAGASSLAPSNLPFILCTAYAPSPGHVGKSISSSQSERPCRQRVGMRSVCGQRRLPFSDGRLCCLQLHTADRFNCSLGTLIFQAQDCVRPDDGRSKLWSRRVRNAAYPGALTAIPMQRTANEGTDAVFA